MCLGFRHRGRGKVHSFLWFDRRLGLLFWYLFFGRGMGGRRSMLSFNESIVPIWAILVVLPGYSGRFNYYSFLEGGELGLQVRKVEPCNSIVVHHLKSKYVWSFQWEVIVDVLQFNIVFANHHPKYVGGLLIIVIFGNVVVHKGHFLFWHLRRRVEGLDLNSELFNIFTTIKEMMWVYGYGGEICQW